VNWVTQFGLRSVNLIAYLSIYNKGILQESQISDRIIRSDKYMKIKSEHF